MLTVFYNEAFVVATQKSLELSFLNVHIVMSYATEDAVQIVN
jgi:hypothetical protein